MNLVVPPPHPHMQSSSSCSLFQLALGDTTTIYPQSCCHAIMPPPTHDARSCAIDATSTDPWGPSHSLMEELRVYTQTRHCADVLHILHDALTSRGPHWRRVLKALTTIAHCLRQGSKEVSLFATAHRALIKQLTRFEYVDAYRLDRGAAVREEAEVVASMLSQHHHRHQQPRNEDTRSSGNSTTYVRCPPSREHIHGAAQHPTASSTTITHHTPPSPHHPLFVNNTTPIFAYSPWSAREPAPLAPRDVTQELLRDSTTLATLISHIEAPESRNAFDPDDTTWLNIYKLLFLLNTSLLTASDEAIRHWSRHTHLLHRLAAAGRAAAHHHRQTTSRSTRNTDPSPNPASESKPKTEQREPQLEVAGAGAGAGAGTESGLQTGTDTDTDTVASEVRRLAGELARIFEGAAGPKEVRRRARMF